MHLQERKASFAITLLILIVSILGAGLIGLVNAASSGTIYFPDTQVSSADNVLHVGYSEKVNITFKNSASATISDVASTIQYITLAAADVNPSRAIIDISVDASWEIYVPSSSTPRTLGTVSGTLDSSAIYTPYSTSQTVYLYTWALGRPGGPSNLEEYTSSGQFTNDMKILRPGEMLNLTVTVQCQGLVGDSVIWFFFKAPELQPATPPISIGEIALADRCNIAYSKLPGSNPTRYWWPLHNSYDPYDTDIGTGHSFGQLDWTRNPTTTAFAKGNKVVHQKPIETQYYSFHICGIKFNDSDRNGIYETGVESPIDNVIITLLGPDQTTEAEIYYPGSFIFPAPDDHNPTYTGENDLTGSYCFNIIVLISGTYTFYVKEELPLGKINTTPVILGPIVLDASSGGTRESLNNNFGNTDPSADLSITKSGPPYAHAGDLITNSFTVSNAGPDSVTGVTVVDDKVGVATYVSGDANLDGKLDVSETWTFTVSRIVSDADPDPFINTGTVSSGTSDPNPSNDASSSSFDILHPALDVIKSGPTYAHEGGIISFAITIKNTGDCKLYDISVTDTLLGSVWTGDLDVGAVKALSVSYTVPAGSTVISNTATATGHDTLGTAKGTATDTASYTVTITTTPPVGGEWVPIDKARLLAPWISLISFVTMVAILFVCLRRKIRRN